MGSVHGVVFKNPLLMTTVKIVDKVYPGGSPRDVQVS